MAGSDEGEADVTGRQKLRALARASLTLSDAETARRFGENAREAVQATYGWRRDAERLRDVYDGLEAAGS